METILNKGHEKKFSPDFYPLPPSPRLLPPVEKILLGSS